MADNATVDFTNVHIIFGGHRVSGYGPGVGITIAFDEPQNTNIVGTDGLGAWVKNANKAATIGLSLLQTSDSNDQLSAFLLADLNTPGGLGYPLAVEDLQGRTVGAASVSKITKLPDTTYGGGVEVRNWEIKTTRLDLFVGGNATTEVVSTP